MRWPLAEALRPPTRRHRALRQQRRVAQHGDAAAAHRPAAPAAADSRARRAKIMRAPRRSTRVAVRARIVRRRDGRGGWPAAGAGEARQRVQRRRRRCRSGQQAAIGDRADALGARPGAAGPVASAGVAASGGSCFLADAWLGACEQAADVGVVTGEHQHGDHQRKLNDGRIGQHGGAESAPARTRPAPPARRSARGGHDQPDGAGAQPDRPGGGDQHAVGRWRPPLPPLKPSQTGRAWPSTAPMPAQSAASWPPNHAGDQHGGRALQRRPAAASPRRGPCCRCAARWSRRYCPSRSRRMSPKPGSAGQQQAERDRAEQVAENAMAIAITRVHPTSPNTRRPAFHVPSTTPSSARPSNGVFCALPGSWPASTCQIALGVEQAEIGGRALGQPARVDAQQRGRPRRQQLDRLRQASARRCAPAPASRPAAWPGRRRPASARANGWRLSSASRGWWSDAIASIVPSASAATTASRSASLRSGGDSLA